MYENEVTFRRGAIRPMQCLREGWQLIKTDYGIFLGVTLLGVLIGSLAPLAILLGPMMCGIYLCLLGRLDGHKPSMSLLFKGFDHFVPSLIATLIMIVPMLMVFVPAYIVMAVVMFKSMAVQQANLRAGQQAGPPDMSFFAAIGVFWLLIMVVSIIVGVLFFFVYPLIVDRRLSGFDAVKVSFKAVFANLGGVVAVMLLNVAIGFLSALCCYFPAFLVMPLHFAAIAIAYRQVFPDRPALDDFDDEPESQPPRGDASSTGIQTPTGRASVK